MSEIFFILHVSICGVPGPARVKRPGSFFHPQSSQEDFLSKHVDWRSHDARCCKILWNPSSGKSSACLCTVSVSYLIVLVLQKTITIPSFWPLSHRSPCLLQLSTPGLMTESKSNETTWEKPSAPTQKSCDGSFVKVPGIPRISLFINNYYETGENNTRPFLIMTCLSLKRFLNRSFILSHLALVFPDISSLWKWSRRLHKLSLSFYCHHLSCNSQEGTSKWMPLYSV